MIAGVVSKYRVFRDALLCCDLQCILHCCCNDVLQSFPYKENNHICVDCAIRVTACKINSLQRLCSVINSFVLQIFRIDSEQVLEIYKHSYNFVYVINQIFKNMATKKTTKKAAPTKSAAPKKAAAKKAAPKKAAAKKAAPKKAAAPKKK
jgi:hypothetical protein